MPLPNAKLMVEWPIPAKTEVNLVEHSMRCMGKMLRHVIPTVHFYEFAIQFFCINGFFCIFSLPRVPYPVFGCVWMKGVHNKTLNEQMQFIVDYRDENKFYY